MAEICFGLDFIATKGTSARGGGTRRTLEIRQPASRCEPHELRIRTRAGLRLDQIVIVLHRLDAHAGIARAEGVGQLPSRVPKPSHLT